MKTLIAPVLFAALMCLGTVATTAASEHEGPERMLVVLTSADTETQAMTLVLSNQVAKSGKPVHLLLCGPAGDIALAKPPADAERVITPKGMTVLSLLKGLQAKGAAVDVCAIYLPNRKLEASALAEGVGVARPPAIAAEMVDDDTRLFTF